MGRWLAGRLIKELSLVSCQQPTLRYKRGGHEYVSTPNHLERRFAVTEPSQVWCGEVTYIWPGKRPCNCSRSVREETGRLGNVVPRG